MLLLYSSDTSAFPFFENQKSTIQNPLITCNTKEMPTTKYVYNAMLPFEAGFQGDQLNPKSWMHFVMTI